MQHSRVHSKVGDSGRKGSGWAALSQQTRGVQDPNQKTFSYVDGSGNRKAPDLSSDYPELPSSTGGATTPKTRSDFCRPTCLTVTLIILGLMLVYLFLCEYHSKLLARVLLMLYEPTAIRTRYGVRSPRSTYRISKGPIHTGPTHTELSRIQEGGITDLDSNGHSCVQSITMVVVLLRGGVSIQVIQACRPQFSC